MPYAELLLEAKYVLLLAIIQCSVYVFGLMILFAYSSVRGGLFTKTWMLVQPFGFAALCVGWLAGNSSSPVLGTVLPAILTLLGGFLTFIFGQDQQARTFVLMGVPAIGLMLYIGTGMGSFEREDFMDFQEQQEIGKLRNELLKAAELESDYETYRNNLNLSSPDNVTTKILGRILDPNQNDSSPKSE